MGTIQEDLLSMGYRQAIGNNNNLFLKPFGYSLFVYDTKTNKLTQYIQGVAQTLVMDSHLYVVGRESFLDFIKSMEVYSTPWPNDVTALGSFDFLDPQQEAELLLSIL